MCQEQSNEGLIRRQRTLPSQFRYPLGAGGSHWSWEMEATEECLEQRWRFLGVKWQCVEPVAARLLRTDLAGAQNRVLGGCLLGMLWGICRLFI